jgi:5-methyltetrahydropteroyltriglutamate--homocysteine methyltransferase
MQEDVGLQSATDGELRRGSWHMDFIYQLGGITRADEQLVVQFQNPEGTIEFTPAALRVNAKIRLDEPIFADAFRFLAGTVTTATPKLTIPSPSMVHYRGGRAAIAEDVYPDLDAFWDDLSAAYAAEVRALYDLGCRYLQLDDTSLAYLNDRAAEMMTGKGPTLHLPSAIRPGISQRRRRSSDRHGVDHAPCAATSVVGRGGRLPTSWPRPCSISSTSGSSSVCDDERSGGFEPRRVASPRQSGSSSSAVTTKRGRFETGR